MLKTASKPIDIQDLQFKLQCRLKIFDTKEGILTKTPKALLATASRFGLVFVGCVSSKLKVFRYESIEENSSTEATTNYIRREVDLISQPHHVSVNCDQTIVGVVVEKDNSLVVLFYDILSFYKENTVLLNEVRLTNTPGLTILQANWHPTINNIFTECKSDGTLGIYELKNNSFEIKKLPAESKACCFCWSPKGKQIAVGSQDGKIIHYKPDLKAVKSIDAPPFEKSHSILSLQWISNYQFVGVFKMCDEADPECSVVLIDAPKTGNPTFTNFYDICYSNGNMRPPQFYMIAEPHWNFLLVASANSMEVGVLSNTGEIWTQCILPDSARAELPLDVNQDETYTVGMTIDTSSVKPVLWGETYLQPAPSLILLSHEGVLCCFKMINLKEGAPNLNTPPEKINDMSGLKHFVTSMPEPAQIFTSPEAFIPEKDANSTPTNTVSAAQPHSPSIFPLANSTVLATPQGSQTPTTPLTIFKAPITKQNLSSTPTNLFGGQISITPVRSKEAALPTSATSVGTMLLSKALSGSTTPDTNNKGTVESVSFSNLLAGSASAETKSKNREPVVQSSTGSGGSITLTNLLSGNSQGKTSNFPEPTSGKTKVRTGNFPVTNVSTPQNTFSGSQKLNEKPNVPSSVTNTIQPQISGRAEKNTEQEESSDIKNMLTKMLQMECGALDKEIRELVFQGQHLRINLDSEEMDKIVHLTEGINEFLKELVDTCEIQTCEGHILKQNTIQSWAWIEEARSRFKESQDEELRNVIKSKPLDSVSEKHLSTLKQMQYYLNSQLTQSHKALDDQWDKFQDYCRKTNRVQLPTMEVIFQTMVKQNAVLQKHNYILKDITSQMKGRQKAFNHAALFNSSDRNDSLERSLQNLKLEPEGLHHIYYQKILNRVKSLPTNKTNQLRRILHNREVPHVTVKSQLSTSVLNSTSILNQQTSISHKTPDKPEISQLSSPPQISSTPLSAFAATNNINSSGKSELTTRFGTEAQRAVPSSEKENVSVGKPIIFGKASIPGDKQSALPQSQNSLFRTPTMNEKVGFNVFSNSSVGKESNQNMFGNNRSSLSSLATPTSQTLKLVGTEPSVPISALSKKNSPLVPCETSSNSNILTSNTIRDALNSSSNSPFVSSQNGAPLKLFSFVSSTAQSNQFTNSASVTSSSSVLSGFNTAATGPSKVSDSTVGTTFSFGKSSGSSGFLNPGNNNPVKNDLGSSTQSLFTGSSLVGFPVPTNKTVPSSSISPFDLSNRTSEMVPKSSETAPKAPMSIFGLGSKTSGDSVSTKVSSVNSETRISSPLTSTDSSGSSAPTTTLSIFQTTTASSSTKSSLFGNTVQNTGSASIFGSFSNKGEFSTTGSSLFANNSGSLFGTSTTATNSTTGTSIPPISSNEVVTDSISTGLSEKAVSTTTSSIFGSSVLAKTISSPPFSTSDTPLMSSNLGPTSGTSVSNTGHAGPTATKSIFGTSNLSMFGNTVTSAGPTTTKSIFGTSGSSDSTVSTSGASIFGASGSKSIFANASEESISKTPVVTTTSGTSVSNSGPTTKSIFGTSNLSMFGNTVTSAGPTTTKSIFGTSGSSDSTVSTSGASIFGASVSKSIFANASEESISKTPVVTTQSSFGTTTNSSLFGTSSFGAVASACSVFGNAAAPASAPFNTVTSASSPFGSSSVPVSSSPFSSSPFASATNSSNSVFGQSASTTSSIATSPFSSATTNVESPFGANPSTPISPFGAVTPSVCSPFGSSQTFGTGFNVNANTQSSPFGQVPTAPNAFGSSNPAGSVFGTENSPSPLGQNSGLENQMTGMFGGFGSSGTKNTEGSFGFGNLNVGTAPQSPFAKVNETKSPFGGTSFNPTTSTGSLFGSSTFGNNNGNSIFGQPTFGNNSAFSSTQQSGAFSGGSGSIAQTGFGVTQNPQQKTSAFGAAPTFGGTPAFGAAPTFGGAPAFGSTSPFGSPSKIFGSPNPSSAGSVFGSNNQPSTGFGGFGNQNLGFGTQPPNNTGEAPKQTSGFGNFASQNTIGFGNLAQQTNNSGQNSPFSGTSSFSSWR